MSNNLFQVIKKYSTMIKFFYRIKYRKFNRIFFCLIGILIFSIFSFNPFLDCHLNFDYYFQLSKFGYLLLFTLFFLFKTFETDAGSVPIKRKKISSLNLKDCYNNMNLKEIKLNYHTIQLKFCRTCMIWRPPRTSHCSLCGGCKLKFDHHCPWIGICIGLKNYQHFFFFILYLFWFLFSKGNFILKENLNSATISSNVTRIFFFEGKNLNYGNHIKKEFLDEFLFILKTFLKIIGFFASIFTGALIIFHVYLGYTGKTTSEFLKFPDKNVKSWNLRKEIINKFYKKKYSTLIRIRFTEVKKFKLVTIDLKKKQSTLIKIKNNNNNILVSLQKFIILLGKIFYFTYLLSGLSYKENNKDIFFYKLYCIFFNLFNFVSSIFSIIIVIKKVLLNPKI